MTVIVLGAMPVQPDAPVMHTYIVTKLEVNQHGVGHQAILALQAPAETAAMVLAEIYFSDHGIVFTSDAAIYASELPAVFDQPVLLDES